MKQKWWRRYKGSLRLGWRTSSKSTANGRALWRVCNAETDAAWSGVRWLRPSIRQSFVLGNPQVQTKKMLGADMLRSFHWARSARVVTLEQRSFPTDYPQRSPNTGQ